VTTPADNPRGKTVQEISSAGLADLDCTFRLPYAYSCILDRFINMQTNLNPDERRAAILKLLSERPRLPVGELASLFQTSEDSVRRDLRLLAEAGKIRRVHGAVLPAAPASAILPDRIGQSVRAKAAIARVVTSRLADGLTVFLDAGSTAQAIAEALPPKARLTVITPGLTVALALADRSEIETIVLGGRLDALSRASLGGETLARIQEFNADIAVVTACSLDVATGLTSAGYEEARIKRAMIASAAATYAVATADKIGTTSPHLIAPLGAVALVVTDAALPVSERRRITDAGVELLVAES
jgi:DeoR/GlpR family transcriptional regulator of sugar metabolism